MHALFQIRNAVVVDQTSEAEDIHEGAQEDDVGSTGDHIEDEEGGFKEDTERECLIKHDKEEDSDVVSEHDDDGVIIISTCKVKFLFSATIDSTKNATSYLRPSFLRRA